MKKLLWISVAVNLLLGLLVLERWNRPPVALTVGRGSSERRMEPLLRDPPVEEERLETRPYDFSDPAAVVMQMKQAGYSDAIIGAAVFGLLMEKYNYLGLQAAAKGGKPADVAAFAKLDQEIIGEAKRIAPDLEDTAWSTNLVSAAGDRERTLRYGALAPDLVEKVKALESDFNKRDRMLSGQARTDEATGGLRTEFENAISGILDPEEQADYFLYNSTWMLSPARTVQQKIFDLDVGEEAYQEIATFAIESERQMRSTNDPIVSNRLQLELDQKYLTVLGPQQFLGMMVRLNAGAATADAVYFNRGLPVEERVGLFMTANAGLREISAAPENERKSLSDALYTRLVSAAGLVGNTADFDQTPMGRALKREQERP